MFEFLDHTADTAVRLTAQDAEGLIQSAVDALRSIYLGEEQGASLGDGAGTETEQLPIALEAEDGEALLIDFLGELIFLFDSRRFLCGLVKTDSVSLGRPASLQGTLVGMTGVVDVEIETEVKAATHHGVRIRRVGGRLTVDVVFDL
jgi:SHS2 domain-containing protein